jgi:hydroxyethylthiazole kinase-like sugar kinase family protein
MLMTPQVKVKIEEGTLWFVRIVGGISFVAVSIAGTMALQIFNEMRADVKTLLLINESGQKIQMEHTRKIESLEQKLTKLESEIFDRTIKQR